MHPDVVRSFIGHFQSSLLHPDTSDASALPPTGSTSQLKAALLSPLSSMLRNSVHCGAGSSGGFGGAGESLDLFVGCPWH